MRFGVRAGLGPIFAIQFRRLHCGCIVCAWAFARDYYAARYSRRQHLETHSVAIKSNQIARTFTLLPSEAFRGVTLLRQLLIFRLKWSTLFS